MALPMTWIRNNMLPSPGRQLTEAELKVQKSLQKLSIPEWYLNKRTNPPKIMNVTPIEFRPPLWKYSMSPSNVTLNSTSSSLSGTLSPDKQKSSPKFNSDVTTPKATKTTGQQKSPEVKQRKSPQKYSLPKDDILNTRIPVAKISSRNNSQTFPKMSPSRKIQNINIVFPPGPKIEISKQLEEDVPTEESKYKTYLIKKSVDSAKKGNNDTNKEDETPKRNNDKVLSKCSGATPKKNNTKIPRKTNEETPKKVNQVTPTKNRSHIAEMATPLRTPDIKTSFKIRAASTPKYSPANLFSSTVIEDYSTENKTYSPNILEKSSIFENSLKLDSKLNITKDRTDSLMEKSVNTLRSEKPSQTLLSRTIYFENNSCEDQEETKTSKSNWLFEKNIRSIDPILFEKDESSSTFKSSSMVREMVKKMELSQNSTENQSFKLLQRKKRNSKADRTCNNSLIQERKSKFEKNVALHLPQSQRSNTEFKSAIPHEKRSSHEKSSIRDLQKKKITSETQSPCSRFLTSKKKSRDLEKVVKSKTPVREKSLVQEIIETLSARVNKTTLPRHSENMADFAGKQNFVKKLVDALEKSEVNKPKEMQVRKFSIIEEDSSSESESKSFVTSTSPKETDSDSGQRSSNLKNDENQRFDYSNLATIHDEQTNQEEDSVYWIPVSRCKLPRTSSLLSMMSRLSNDFQSPCVSPIRSETEVETVWATTLKRTSTISKKLFRIDETIVIDSGYSDKSDKSAISSAGSCGLSSADYTWSEDNLNDSEAEIVSSTFKKSSRRRSAIGKTHCIP